MKGKNGEALQASLEPPVLDEDGMASYLVGQTDVVAAYLFGSVASDKADPHSDVDIAVLFANASNPLAAGDRQLQLIGDLERFTDRALDVVILNTAPPILQHQVLRHGRLLCERDREARVEFEVRAGKIYADLKPMYDFHTHDLLHKIKEVGLGGRRRRRRQPETLKVSENL
jgi:predicted nucleotidyltransferase